MTHSSTQTAIFRFECASSLTRSNETSAEFKAVKKLLSIFGYQFPCLAMILSKHQKHSLKQGKKRN